MTDEVPLSFAFQITWNSGKKTKNSTDSHPLFFGYRSLGYILLLRLSQSPTQKLYALGAFYGLLEVHHTKQGSQRTTQKNSLGLDGLSVYVPTSLDLAIVFHSIISGRQSYQVNSTCLQQTTKT